jgi:AsmA protein
MQNGPLRAISEVPPAMTSSPVRKLLTVFAVLLVLLAAAAAWLVATFDADAYKGLAVDWVKTHRDRTLVIGGPVKLSVFPKLTVKLTDVTLSEKGQRYEFAALNSVSLSVNLMPLLRKRLEVDEVSARGLRVVYRRNEGGRSNIDDLVSVPAPADGEARAPGGEAVRFDVKGIRLDDLRLSIRDELAKVSGEVGIDAFSTGRLADKLESPVELDAQLALKSPAVQGRLTGKTRLTLDLDAGTVGLRETRLAWKGDVPGARALDAQLAGSLSFDSRKGTVAADDIDLQWDAVLGGTELSGSRLTMKKFAYDPVAKVVALDQLALKVAGKQNGHPLELSLAWPALSVTGQSLTGSALSGSLSFEGPQQSARATFKSAAPTGNFEQVRVPGFQATLSGAQGPRKLDGTVGADLLLQMAAKALVIDALQARLKIQEPSLQPLSLGIQGRAQASAQAAQWALKGAINGNPFHTEGQARLADSPPSLQASATFQSLDLNRLLAPPAKPAPAAGGKPDTGAAPAAPVDLSALGALQGRFTARVGDFSYQTYRIGDAALDATLEGGVLRVGRLSGRIWGGTLDASLSADSRSNRFAAKATAQGVDINALLKDVAQKDLLEGTGRVTLDVDTAGRNTGELKSRLHGSASLQLRDGAVKGVNLARTLRQARAAVALRQDARQPAVQTEKTDFSEMSASFALQDGVARNSDLLLKSPFLRLGGDGQVDIGRNRIDYTVRATLAETSKGQDGADLALLKGLTIPVRLDGPLEAIAWTVQWSAVAANALKSELGTQLQDKLKDRLREKLGQPPAAAEGAASAGAPAPSPKEVLKEKLLRGLFK